MSDLSMNPYEPSRLAGEEMGLNRRPRTYSRILRCLALVSLCTIVVSFIYSAQAARLAMYTWQDLGRYENLRGHAHPEANVEGDLESLSRSFVAIVWLTMVEATFGAVAVGFWWSRRWSRPLSAILFVVLPCVLLLVSLSTAFFKRWISIDAWNMTFAAEVVALAFLIVWSPRFNALLVGGPGRAETPARNDSPTPESS
jgi:hypothetical protein